MPCKQSFSVLIKVQYCTTVVLFLILAFSSQCCVCELELPSSSAHKCLECGFAVHAICGQNPDGDEGYGIPVVCNICLKSAISAEEKKKTRELSPQFQVFTTASLQIFKFCV